MYEHHCIEQLPGPTRALRDGALYMVNNIEAVQWALELYGFKNVVIKVCISATSSPAACITQCPSPPCILYTRDYRSARKPHAPHEAHLAIDCLYVSVWVKLVSVLCYGLLQMSLSSIHGVIGVC